MQVSIRIRTNQLKNIKAVKYAQLLLPNIPSKLHFFKKKQQKKSFNRKAKVKLVERKTEPIPP
jgi:hypothetical protein